MPQQDKMLQFETAVKGEPPLPKEGNGDSSEELQSV